MVFYTTLTIDAVAYTDMTDITVKNKISESNALSTANITFPNYYGRHNDDFNIGDEIEIKADKDVNPPTTVIFKGVIKDIQFQGSANTEIVTLEAKDYATRLQDITIPPTVYTNSEVSTIVTDLIADNTIDITTTSVDVTTTTLSRKVFKHVSLFDAIKELAEIVGFIFYVNTNKVLNFIASSKTSSGITFDRNNVTKATFRTNADEMANEIWVYGGSTYKGNRETFFQDGTGSKFTLGYSPYDTEVFVNGSIKKGDVYNMITIPDSGQEYLVDFGSKLIIFTSGTDAGNNIPGSPGSVVVNYNMLRPIVRVGYDTTSIETYGKISKVIIDTTIDVPETADDILSSQLELYKNPLIEGTLNLQDTIVVTAGQTAVVNLPNFNISNQIYTINEVIYKINSQTALTNEITTIKVSRHISDVVDALKEVIMELKRLRAEEVDTSSTLTRVLYGQGSYVLQVSGWGVYTRDMGSSFVLGDTILGKLGPSLSPQPRLGDSRGALTIQRSGTGKL